MTVGQPMLAGPQVEVLDRFGNRVSGRLPITSSVRTTSGLTTAPMSTAAINGLATFPSRTINKASDGYRIVMSGAGLPTITSNPFNARATWFRTGDLVGFPNLWHERGAVPLPDGRVLAVGDAQSEDGVASTSLYDVATGTWTPSSETMSPHEGGVAPELHPLPSGDVFLAASRIGSRPEVLDVSSMAWTNAAESFAPDGAHNVAFRRCISSVPFQSLSPSEIYDPIEDEWVPTGTANFLHGEGKMVTLADGRVIAAGGQSAQAAEIWNPTTGQWTVVAPMQRKRRTFAMVRLSDGRVFVAGGLMEQTANAGARRGEIYDPLTNTWTLTSEQTTIGINWSKTAQDATLLPDGRVILSGGYNIYWAAGPNGDYQSSSEIFDPSTNTWSNYRELPQQGHMQFAVLLKNGRVLRSGDGQSTPRGNFGMPHNSVHSLPTRLTATPVERSRAVETCRRTARGSLSSATPRRRTASSRSTSPRPSRLTHATQTMASTATTNGGTSHSRISTSPR